MAIYDTPNLVRMNGDFSPTDKLRDYAMNPDWRDFTSFWGIISGAQEEIGRQSYERIANFVQNVRDIDYCGLHELYSLATELNVEHLFSYDLAYPAELDKLMNILSVNRTLLTTSGAFFKSSTLSSLFNDSDLSSSFSLSGEFIPDADIADHPLSRHRRYMNVATVSSSSSHEFTVGQNIMISGFMDDSFNGYYTVGNIVSENEFRYPCVGSDSVWSDDIGIVRTNRMESYFGESSERVIPDDRYVTGFIEPALSAHLIRYSTYPDDGTYNIGDLAEYDSEGGFITFTTSRVSNFSKGQKVSFGNISITAGGVVSLKGVHEIAAASDFNHFTIRRTLDVDSGFYPIAGSPKVVTPFYIPGDLKVVAESYRGFMDEIYSNPSTEFASDSGNIILESTHVLRNIALRASYQRDTLKNIVKKHAIIGTAKAVERVIKEYMLRSFTKKSDWRLYSPSGEVIPALTGDQIMEKYVPNLTYTLMKGMRADVVEYYDNTEYLNVSAAASHLTGVIGYTNVTSTLWELTTTGGMVSSEVSFDYPVYGQLSGYVVTGGNTRYWEGDDLSEAMLFSEHTNAEISAFYVNAGLTGDFHSIFKFQSALWDMGAVSGYDRYAKIYDLSGTLTPQYSSYLYPVEHALYGHSRYSNVATVSSSTEHNLTLGQDIMITGFLDTTYNARSNVVRIVNETIFEYDNIGTNSTTAADDGIARFYHNLNEVPTSGWIIPRTDLSPIQRKYIGTLAGDNLPANSKNTLYPTVATQPFLWNLVEKVAKDYPELLASILYSEHVSKAFYSDQVDASGNLVDSWKYFNREMLGYQSAYEEYTNYDWQEKLNPAVDRDGPFDPNALSALIDLPSPLSDDDVNSLSGYYRHIRRGFNIWKTTPNIVDQLRMYKDDIIGLSGYNIAQFSYDLYDHQYMLYKESLTGDINDPGHMWMRYRNHPIPFPLSTNLSGGINYSQLYFGGGFGTWIYDILDGGTNDFGLYDNLLWIVGRPVTEYQVVERSRTNGVASLTFPTTSHFKIGDYISVEQMLGKDLACLDMSTYDGCYSILSGIPSGCPSTVFVRSPGDDESAVSTSGFARHSTELHLFTNRYVNKNLDKFTTKNIIYATFENDDVPPAPMEIGSIRNFIGSYRKDTTYAVFVYAIPYEYDSDGVLKYKDGWNIRDLNILGNPSEVKFVFEHYNIETKQYELSHPDRFVVVGSPGKLPADGGTYPPYHPSDNTNTWRLSVSEDIVTIAYESKNRYSE